jgi:hypothetical protein
MDEPVLLRHALWVGAELATQRKVPRPDRLPYC